MAVIIGISTVVGIAIAILIAAVFLYRDSALEKFYAKSVKKATVECLGVSTGMVDIPTKIIVNTGHKWSVLRAQVKKAIVKISGHKDVPEILIFGPMSGEEQKVFLIQKGFSNILTIEVLDLEFQEDLIKYETYKFIRERKFDEAVKALSRKEFERTRNRIVLINLDSLEFSRQVVLNPPPEERPVLRNLVLPIAYAKQKEIEEKGKGLQEVEKDKIVIMSLINMINNRKWGVVFFGKATVGEYISLVSENIGRLSSLLLGARGKYIDLLVYGSPRIESGILSEIWEGRYESWSAEGRWEFPSGLEVDCLWHYYYKS